MKRQVGGDVAIDVAQQLADPLRALRDRLGLVVDHLERHVASSTGPTPYPWRSLQALRQDLSTSYLEATTVARRVDELDQALADETVDWFDLAAAVDLGLRLADHHLGAGIEVLIDLGTIAPARGSAGACALLVAQLVAHGARSARAVAGSTLTVRVTGEAGWGVVLIADNGSGEPVAALAEVAREVLAPWGGEIAATSEPGLGCTFELRVMTRPA